MNAWQSMVTCAVQGTARRPPVREEWLAELPDTLGLHGDPATQILDGAALATVARRAGCIPLEASPVADTAVPPDDRPEIPWELCQEFPEGVWLLFLLTAAAERGMRLPAVIVPIIFDRANGWPALHEPALQLAGELGAFLLPLNPEWQKLARRGDQGHPLAPATTDDSVWRIGSDNEERVAWLLDLRHRDTTAALPYLQAALAVKGEPVAVKEALLQGLTAPITGAEAQLLETCLDSRLARVRAAAADALSRGPSDSAFAERMVGRVHSWLSWRVSPGGTFTLRTQLFPLTERDERDGFSEPVATGTAGLSTSGVRYRLLAQASPLTAWAALGSPAELVAAAPNRELVAGWVQRVLFEHDDTWVRPLLATGQASELVVLLPEAEADEYVAELLAAAEGGGPTAAAALAEINRVPKLPLSDDNLLSLVRALPGLVRGSHLPSGVLSALEGRSPHLAGQLIAELERVIPLVGSVASASLRHLVARLRRVHITHETRQRILLTLDRACAGETPDSQPAPLEENP